MKYVTLCKRTNYPKLAYIQDLLNGSGIPHRCNGWSFHAPILEVPEQFESAAMDILSAPARKTYDLPVRFGVSLDDVPDDHPCFNGIHTPDDDDSEMESEADWYAEINRGYAQDRI